MRSYGASKASELSGGGRGLRSLDRGGETVSPRRRGRGKAVLACGALVCASFLACDGVSGQESGSSVSGQETVGSDRSGSESSTGSRALVIGINIYKAVPNLRGAVNDAQAMKQVLETRFGFDSGSITLLLNEEATRARVLSELEKLTRAGADERVVFFFAGHGSQVKDLDGDEKRGDPDDQKDETLITYDARTDGIADITDDELGALLGRIASPNLTVISDTCHSGTNTRSINVQTRSVEEDDRIELYQRTASREVVPTEADYLAWGAAGANQQALDARIDGRFAGVFTHALIKSLRGAKAVTHRELEARIQAELEKVKAELALLAMPEPQLEGPEEWIDRPFLGLPESRLAWLPLDVLGEGRVRLPNAAALGAEPGSRWAIYPDGEQEFVSGRELALIEIDRVDGQDAFGVTVPKQVALPRGGARVVAYDVAPTPVEATLAWLGSAGREKRSEIQSQIAVELPGARFVDPEVEPALFHLEKLPAGWQILGADGSSPIAMVASEQARAIAEQVRATVVRQLDAQRLLMLDNPAAALELSIAVYDPAVHGPIAPIARGLSISVAPSATTPVLRIWKSATESRSRSNSLQLYLRANRECYLTIAHVDPAGDIGVIFPNPVSDMRGFYPEGRIPGETPILIPDDLESENRAGFFLDASEPAGLDHLKAFCTENRPLAERIRVALVTPDQAGSASPLEQLRRELRPEGSAQQRGFSIVEDTGALPAVAAGAPSDWGAAELVIRVQ